MGPFRSQARSSSTAFWITAGAVAVVMFASAAPSPLYPVYQRLWGFSSTMLTVIFAVYVGPLLISLLMLGSVSDHIGRRPVAVGSLLLLLVAMVVFATAGSETMLLVARVVQGLATGAAMSVLTAAMVDSQPSRRIGTLAVAMAPSAGLGAGLAISALLVQYAPSPRHLVYELMIAALVALVTAVIVFVPETSSRPGFSSAAHAVRSVSPRVSIPRVVRSPFLSGVAALIATWSLGGLMLALGTSIIADRLGIANHALAGALLAVFFLAATVATPRASAARRRMGLPTSYACLGGGVVLLLVAALSGSVALYALALLAAGTGFSTAYVGVIASLAHVPAERRSQLFAAVYVVSYLAFSVPVVISGLATDRYGLGASATGYAIFVLVMVAVAAASLRSRARAADQPAAEPAIACSAAEPAIVCDASAAQ
jgi:predicted MFS family arabinose efflux permease